MNKFCVNCEYSFLRHDSKQCKHCFSSKEKPNYKDAVVKALVTHFTDCECEGCYFNRFVDKSPLCEKCNKHNVWFMTTLEAISYESDETVWKEKKPAVK